MNRKIIFCLILSLPALTAAFGQVRQPNALYFMETIPQTVQMNPALQPRANGYVMLPGVNFDQIGDLGVLMTDLMQQQGNKWVTPLEKDYDYGKLRKSIGKKSTMINQETNADILGFGFRTGKGNGYFSLGLSVHYISNLALPSDLFKITENGFPDGTSLDFSPLRAQTIAYKQIRIGYSRKINDRLTVGVNVKPLFGAMAVATKIDQFDLHTGSDRWELNAKGNIYSSAPIDVKTDADGKLIGGLDGIEVRDLDSDDYSDYGKSFKNPGIAFDLGAEYQINERLTVSAALNNLGFISWKQDLNGMSFNGQYTFNGVNYDVSKDDDFGKLFETLGDSVANAVGYVMHHDKFRTALPPVLHIGGTYQLTKAISAGLLSRSVFWRKGVRQSFHASLSLQPYSFLALNAGATWQVKGNIAPTFGFTFLAGPLQFYFLADGIPMRYSNLKESAGTDMVMVVPEHMKFFTVRTGINLIFGRHGYGNKPMLDKGKSSWN